MMFDNTKEVGFEFEINLDGITQLAGKDEDDMMPAYEDTAAGKLEARNRQATLHPTIYRSNQGGSLVTHIQTLQDKQDSKYNEHQDTQYTLIKNVLAETDFVAFRLDFIKDALRVSGYGLEIVPYPGYLGNPYNFVRYEPISHWLELNDIKISRIKDNRVGVPTLELNNVLGQCYEYIDRWFSMDSELFERLRDSETPDGSGTLYDIVKERINKIKKSLSEEIKSIFSIDASNLKKTMAYMAAKESDGVLQIHRKLDGTANRFLPLTSEFKDSLSEISNEELLCILEPSDVRYFMHGIGRAFLSGGNRTRLDNFKMINRNRGFFILLSETPGLGKSALFESLKTVGEVMGFRVSAVKMDGNQFGGSAYATTDLTYIEDVNDSSFDNLIKSPDLKTIASGGSLVCEEKFEKRVVVQARSTIFINANRIDRKKISALDSGERDRINILTCRTRKEVSDTSDGKYSDWTQSQKYFAEKHGVSENTLVALLISRCVDVYLEDTQKGQRGLMEAVYKYRSELKYRTDINASDSLYRGWLKLLVMSQLADTRFITQKVSMGRLPNGTRGLVTNTLQINYDKQPMKLPEFELSTFCNRPLPVCEDLNVLDSDDDTPIQSVLAIPSVLNSDIVKSLCLICSNDTPEVFALVEQVIGEGVINVDVLKKGKELYTNSKNETTPEEGFRGLFKFLQTSDGTPFRWNTDLVQSGWVSALKELKDIVQESIGMLSNPKVLAVFVESFRKTGEAVVVPGSAYSNHVAFIEQSKTNKLHEEDLSTITDLNLKTMASIKYQDIV